MSHFRFILGRTALGIGVWSIKPTTKLKLFTSKDASLRPADSGKGIYRAYLPLLMCIEGQKVLHNMHISIAEWQHIYVRCLDGSHITCRVNRKRGAYDQLRSEVFAKTGIPPNMQQLLANRKLVKSSSHLTKNSTSCPSKFLCPSHNSFRHSITNNVPNIMLVYPHAKCFCRYHNFYLTRFPL